MVDISSYDEIVDENTRQTKLHKSLSDFRRLIGILNSINCKDHTFLLLNKHDLLESKINAGKTKLEGLLTKLEPRFGIEIIKIIFLIFRHTYCPNTTNLIATSQNLRKSRVQSLSGQQCLFGIFFFRFILLKMSVRTLPG